MRCSGVLRGGTGGVLSLSSAGAALTGYTALGLNVANPAYALDVAATTGVQLSTAAGANIFYAQVMSPNSYCTLFTLTSSVDFAAGCVARLSTTCGTLGMVGGTLDCVISRIRNNAANTWSFSSVVNGTTGSVGGLDYVVYKVNTGTTAAPVNVFTCYAVTTDWCMLGLHLWLDTYANSSDTAPTQFPFTSGITPPGTRVCSLFQGAVYLNTTAQTIS